MGVSGTVGSWEWGIQQRLQNSPNMGKIALTKLLAGTVRQLPTRKKGGLG